MVAQVEEGENLEDCVQIINQIDAVSIDMRAQRSKQWNKDKRRQREKWWKHEFV